MNAASRTFGSNYSFHLDEGPFYDTLYNGPHTERAYYRVNRLRHPHAPPEQSAVITDAPESAAAVRPPEAAFVGGDMTAFYLAIAVLALAIVMQVVH